MLDLRYETRDIDQSVTSQQKIDEWFEAKTCELTPFDKTLLKQKWGTMQKVLSSKSRLEQIVGDILMDMETKTQLMDGRGNAMLGFASVYEAYKVYDMFSKTEFKNKCAIVTSYKPTVSDIKGEDAGEGLTAKLFKYDVYRKMLADYYEQSEDEAAKRVEDFEKEVKQRFIKEPSQMRLLVVVDKFLTGFDALSATYSHGTKQSLQMNRNILNKKSIQSTRQSCRFLFIQAHVFSIGLKSGL